MKFELIYDFICSRFLTTCLRFGVGCVVANAFLLLVSHHEGGLDIGSVESDHVSGPFREFLTYKLANATPIEFSHNTTHSCYLTVRHLVIWQSLVSAHCLRDIK
jgi:hypothetical protein